MAKAMHVGVREGGGPPPGFDWSVCYLSIARAEAQAFLSEEQYAHAADLTKALAAEPNPRRPATVSVDQIEQFFELRDKGGVLGKINLRIYFVVEDDARTILVLGAIKKEAEGQTPEWVKIRIRGRLRKYRAGEYGRLARGAG